ncbi:MAG: VPS10 domain-containing protein, partial [Candidatus Aminicenantales bacterium]
ISESPLKYGLVYAGTDDGRLWVTKDGGKAWQEITAGLAPGKWISRVVASAYQLGTVYLSQNGKRDDDFTPYVWKSADYGKTWTSLAKGIPVGPVNVIREDPVNENVLYVGTDMGVYVTTDSGKTWMVLGGNLPTAYVHDLIVHPRDNIIVIATHGRGMWAMDADKVNNRSARRRFDFED